MDYKLVIFLSCLILSSAFATIKENEILSLAITKHDFSKEGKCEKVFDWADSYAKEINSRGLKTGGIWFDGNNLNCSLRILFAEVKTSPTGAFESFIKEKQDALFEGQKIHIYKVVNVVANIQLVAGISDKSANYEVIATKKLIPMFSADLWEFSTFIFKVLGKQYLGAIETDPSLFLAYLTKEISKDYANEFRDKVLKNSNRIEVSALPHLGIDNGEFVAFSVPIGHAKNCKQDWPNCRFAK